MEQSARFALPAPPGHRKITVSLPFALLADLDSVSTFLGLNRSALLTSLLQDALHDLAMLRAALDSPSSPAEKALRFRGASVDVINTRLAEFQAALKSLPPSEGA